MKARQWKTEGTTLLEILFVVMIIAILMALLLPSIAKSKFKAKRVQCVANFKQHGVAFHMFAHDHQGRFPMQVSTNEGGSLEFMRLATNFGGEIYFSFRHYQAMARELDTPKILVCPTDTRVPAEDFYALRNENISYFITGTAEYQNPQSILAGDRNIETYTFGPRSVLRLNSDDRPGWTSELHQFYGNLLFADSHVEGVNNNGLRAALGTGAGGQTIVLAPVQAPPASSSSSSTDNGSQGSVSESVTASEVAAANTSNSTADKVLHPKPPGTPNAQQTAALSSPSSRRPRTAALPSSGSRGPVEAEPAILAQKEPVPSTQPARPAVSDDEYRPDSWPAFIAQYITRFGAKATWLLLLIIGAILVWLDIRRRRIKIRKEHEELPQD